MMQSAHGADRALTSADARVVVASAGQSPMPGRRFMLILVMSSILNLLCRLPMLFAVSRQSQIGN